MSDWRLCLSSSSLSLSLSLFFGAAYSHCGIMYVISVFHFLSLTNAKSHSERLPLTVNAIRRGNFTVGTIIPDGIESVRWRLCSPAISPFLPLLSFSLSPCTYWGLEPIELSAVLPSSWSTSVISVFYVCRCAGLTLTNAKSTSRGEYTWLFYFFQSFGVRDLGYLSTVRWWVIVGDSIILSQHLRWKTIMTLP